MEDHNVEVVIPTFVSAHLFWIIEKKDYLLISAVGRYFKAVPPKHLLPRVDLQLNQHVLVNIEGMWLRANIILIDYNTNTFVCWLLDYGVLRLCDQFYKLPAGFDFPPIAKQASLYNVVNLDLGLNFEQGFVPIHIKTLSPVNGVTVAALDWILGAEKLKFVVEDERNSILYGDIQSEQLRSLTQTLCDTNCLAVDEALFRELFNEICVQKEQYFSCSCNWNRPISWRLRDRQNDTDILFNVEENVYSMEYLKFKNKTIQMNDGEIRNDSVSTDGISNISNDNLSVNDSLIDVIVPTFINPHLFWIIDKNHIFVRSAIERFLANNPPNKVVRVIDNNLVDGRNKMFAIYQKNIWRRVFIIKDLSSYDDDNKSNRQFVVWLVDYGILHVIISTDIFELPDDLMQFPALAKRASLYNVVNLEENVSIDESQMKFVVNYKKTTNTSDTVRNKSLDYISSNTTGNKLLFNIISDKPKMIYGDLICISTDDDDDDKSSNDNKHYSLTDFLIDHKLLERDVEGALVDDFFQRLDEWETSYFGDRKNWRCCEDVNVSLLPNSHQLLAYNSEENNISMGYFTKE